MLSETHLGVRAKCPQGFELIGRSKQVSSKIPRGGVAIYKSLSSSLAVELVYDGFRDCVVCQVRDTSVIIVALYIPPINSVYFDDSYFMNLDIIYRKFYNHQVIITGDLNCRIGTPTYDVEHNYTNNPDGITNANGEKLLRWLEGKNVLIVNGLSWKGKVHDSRYTWYRGKLRSQNDLIISNGLDEIASLKIMEKEIYSDHCPVSLTYKIKPECSLSFINQCAMNVFNDDQLDINKRKLTPLKVERIEWSTALVDLENRADVIQERIDGGINNEQLNALITTSIYGICKNNYKQRSEKPERRDTDGCHSKNYKAIAQMNLYTYEYHLKENSPMEVCEQYLLNWIKYEEMANDAESVELDTRKNSAWKNVKGDGKKMWERIDWKGKAEEKKEVLIRDQDVDTYFRDIFQSEKTQHHPKIAEIQSKLDVYESYVPTLDDPITQEEFDSAMKKLGKGCGLDGIPANIVQILPSKMRNVVFTLLKNTFDGEYPRSWTKQILNAHPKDGHTSDTPKLRGTSLAEIFARLYDIIITNRFRKWYIPNRQQAGFRKGQGCLLQLFVLNLIIHHAKENSLNFIVLFMDYEKAFDYANRYELIDKLMGSNCGAKFTKAVAKMYASTSYIPFVNNKMGLAIETSYGVAQGRNSSPEFYSFYVSDMPQCTNDISSNDFMDPDAIAQLADDTAMLAELFESFKEKTTCILDYSAANYQVPNIPKTVYCHFSNDPTITPIKINDNIDISSVDPKKGHRYLGMKYLPTEIFPTIIQHNLNDRKGRICKFYAWLEDNKDTPIEFKLLVLDNCLFLSLLYGVETWGDISCIEKEVRMIELKALKAILQVKAGTSTDLIFNELKRADIISRIKDLQYKFFEKVQSLSEEEALVSSILKLCLETSMVQYYTSLHDHNRTDNIEERTRRIMESESSMTMYYKNLIDVDTEPVIYSSCMNDAKRNVITRWRLSNHRLKVELGRYSVPKVPREERKCDVCNVLEDEHHAIFVCPVFHNVRMKHCGVMLKYDSIKSLLNPEYVDMYQVANFLGEIDDVLRNR